MPNQTAIKWVGLTLLHGDYYLQFNANGEYYVYKFYSRKIAMKVHYQATMFSAGKAFNQAKKKCAAWFKTEDKQQWYGHWFPENMEQPELKPQQMDMGLDIPKHKPVPLKGMKSIVRCKV